MVAMQSAVVIYHVEPEGIWAETPTVPTLTATAESFPELQRRVFASLIEVLGPDVEVEERVAADMPRVEPRFTVQSSVQPVIETTAASRAPVAIRQAMASTSRFTYTAPTTDPHLNLVAGLAG
jgi:hypothetical protein